MTNEDAIGILAIVVETAKGRCFVTDEAISDAYAMAISALNAQELSETQKALDTISRQAAIDALEKVATLFPWKVQGNRDSYDRYNEAWNDAIGRAEIEIEELPSAQPEYEPVKAEDFARTMSKNTIYGFMAWHGEALELMKEQGFVICKKTT